MYERILICTDGSEMAQKGVEHGLSLARALGARVTLITVAETSLAYLGGDGALTAAAYDDYLASLRSAAETALAKAKEAADRTGVGAGTVYLEDAPPAEAIVETATANGCDLIVMSSHGRRGLRRLILGSVAAEVLASSAIPVLVVR